MCIRDSFIAFTNNLIFRTDAEGNMAWNMNVPDGTYTNLIPTSDQGFLISRILFNGSVLEKYNSDNVLEWETNFLDDDYWNIRGLKEKSFSDGYLIFGFSGAGFDGISGIQINGTPFVEVPTITNAYANMMDLENGEVILMLSLIHI